MKRVISFLHEALFYVKALFISLVSSFLLTLTLRYGFDFLPKNIIYEVAFTKDISVDYTILIPIIFFIVLSLSFARSYYRKLFTSIAREERLPASVLTGAWVLYFVDTRLTAYTLVLYLIIQIISKYFLLSKEDRASQPSAWTNLKDLPLYQWALIALFLLAGIGLLWRVSPTIPNRVDRYLLCLLMPLSLAFFRLKSETIYYMSRLVFSLILFLITGLILYIFWFSLFNLKDILAFLRFPLDKMYIHDVLFFLDYSYWVYFDFHPSYAFLMSSVAFLIALFPPKSIKKLEQRTFKYELILFFILIILFQLVTHLRYGLLFICALLSICFYAKYETYCFQILKRYAWLLALLFVGGLTFVYIQQDIFIDTYRWTLYQDTWAKIKAHLPLGLGTGADSKMLIYPLGHAHNLLLSMMFNYGILGVLWVIVYLFSLLKGALQGNKPLMFFSLLTLPLMIIDSPYATSYCIYGQVLSYYLFYLLYVTREGK